MSRRGLIWLIPSLALAAAAGLGSDASRLLHRSLPLEQPRVLDVASGQTLIGLLSQLQRDGLLAPARLSLYLRIHARLRGLSDGLKSGEYRLEPGLTASGLLSLVTSGRTVLHELSLLEGWTFAQALDAVRAHPALRQTAEAADPQAVMAALGQAGLHPEGQLLPDTYRFARGTTDLAFLRRAFLAQQSVLADEWRTRASGLPYQKPYEALILASIVEKETGLAAERPQIAGVFINRLERRMRLQTDPTVIYGMGAAYRGNLRRKDLTTDTPYNTYTRRGLPPTPICLPGRAAITAALHPQATSALYFVARGDGSGAHVFSDTLAEHNAAVRDYLRNLRRSRP
jgi:UPF0755 protein